MPRIPKYIEQRIRAIAPTGCNVVRGSTPVISFGDVTKAAVATLGINPSKIEFLENKTKAELPESKRRLSTIKSLGLKKSEELSIHQVQKIFTDCCNYFRRNPYKRWFDQLEVILNSISYSYYDGSACHLDLVQWATDPTWGKLPTKIRKNLIIKDSQFLNQQIQQKNIKLILLNGTGVISELKRQIDNVYLEEIDRIDGLSYRATKLFSGNLGSTQLIGWSTNLQSSHGVTNELRSELTKRVKKMAKKL